MSLFSFSFSFSLDLNLMFESLFFQYFSLYFYNGNWVDWILGVAEVFTWNLMWWLMAIRSLADMVESRPLGVFWVSL